MKSTLTDEIKENVRKLFLEPRSCYSVAKELGVATHIIRWFANKEKIKHISGHINQGRKIWFNQNIFSNIDNEEKAYWLGFLMGDGSIIKNNHIHSVVLELHKRDLNHINKFRDFLGTTHKISKTRKNCYKMTVSSSILVNDLIKLGIIPNKTYLSIKTPDIDTNLLPHFYRGLIDADGCIFKAKNTVQCGMCLSSSCEDFLKTVHQWFCTSINMNRGRVSFSPANEKHGSVYNLFFHGNIVFIKIYRLLYKDANIYLDRKKQKIEKLAEFIKNRPYVKPGPKPKLPYQI